MSFDRTIVLDSDAKLNAALSMISSNWREMVNAEHPMAVRLYEHKDKRTLEQQALMWIRLAEISDQAWIGGRKFDAEVWHEHYKRQFLPEEDGPTKRCRKGYRKWVFLPSGERDLIGSTTQLTVFGMAEYMTQVMAEAATELGVLFAPTPREAEGFR
jgi:hypothetical protein